MKTVYAGFSNQTWRALGAAVSVMTFCAVSVPAAEMTGMGGDGAKAAPVFEMPDLTAPPPAEKKDPKAVIVEVDGTKLTQGELDEQVDRWRQVASERMNPRNMERYAEQFREQMIEQFVVKTILVNEANRRKIEVTAKDIDSAINELRARLPEGLKLEDVMKNENITEADLRKNLGMELRVKKMIDADIKTNMAPPESEIRKFYETSQANFQVPESVRARHILIKVEQDDDVKARAEKKAKAEALRKKLTEGADFAALAKENSDCPSRERGGDLGAFPRGKMVPAFENAAFSQATNAIGPVVETTFGYHIIQVMEHTPDKTMSYDDVKDKIAVYLTRQKEQETVREYVEALRAKARISYAGSAAGVSVEPTKPAVTPPVKPVPPPPAPKKDAAPVSKPAS